MNRTTGLIGLAVAGGTIAAGAGLYNALSEQNPPGSHGGSLAVVLQADPREIDEGDLVAFVATVEARDAGAISLTGHTYAWDFGDGSQQLTGAGLSDVTHRYADNGSPGHLAVVRVDGHSEATHRVNVRNVPPTIRSIFQHAAGDQR